MGMLHNLENWSTTHHPRWLLLPRIALGICLILKGISFLNNTIILESIISETSFGLSGGLLPIIITWLHLLCGSFIVIGLMTRWASLLMIPILLAAVVFVNTKNGIFAADSELGFSLVVLLLLIFFFIEGGGPYSLDNFFKKNPK